MIVGAMAAGVAAAGSSSEMGGGREDDISILQVEILLRCRRLSEGQSCFRNHRFQVGMLYRQPREGFKTRSTEAGGFEIILRQATEEVDRSHDFPAPGWVLE
jgi:hypothetical protein